jgi:hypothetical protein
LKIAQGRGTRRKVAASWSWKIGSKRKERSPKGALFSN